jgi:hypothetical protein
MSTPRDMQSFIVWMMAGIAERETGRKAMRRWREPREMVGIFRCAVHENGAKEVYCIPAICPDKVRLGIARSLAGTSERKHVASTHNESTTMLL